MAGDRLDDVLIENKETGEQKCVAHHSAPRWAKRGWKIVPPIEVVRRKQRKLVHANQLHKELAAGWSVPREDKGDKGDADN